MDLHAIKKVIYHHDKLASLYNVYRNWNRNRWNRMSDEEFVKWRYRQVTGKELNLESPQTYDDKLNYLKLYNRDPLLKRCSDKVAVRDYVRECGLEHILNEIYGVYDSVEQIPWDSLPDRCMIKCSHTSGANIIFDRHKNFDYDYFRNEFSFWLQRDFFWTGREWNYKGMEPKIIAERFLVQKTKEPLVDFRFMCFGGEVKLLLCDIESISEDGAHNAGAKRNIYDKEFKLLEGVRFSRENFPPELLPKPENYEEMVEYAERLSKPFLHARVDLYNVDGKIYFGEITFYHQSGFNQVTPESLYYDAGSWIDLSRLQTY